MSSSSYCKTSLVVFISREVTAAQFIQYLFFTKDAPGNGQRSNPIFKNRVLINSTLTLPSRLILHPRLRSIEHKAQSPIQRTFSQLHNIFLKTDFFSSLPPYLFPDMESCIDLLA